jgi:3-hydroxymyristoyl/3-hydroxydecanoyl-(acyl carrier protein) dehydratase
VVVGGIFLRNTGVLRIWINIEDKVTYNDNFFFGYFTRMIFLVLMGLNVYICII